MRTCFRFDMRYRNRTLSYCPIITLADFWRPDLVTPQGDQTQPCYGQTRQWYTPNGYRFYNEVMADDGSVAASGFKSVSHTREVNNFYADPVDHTFPLSWRGNLAVKNVSVVDVENAFDALTVPDIDWDAYAEQACAFMLPRINEGSSLINFVLELKDLKSMNPKPSLDRIVKGRHKRVGPEQLIQLGKKKQSKEEFAKELAHRLTSAHLNASFGIVPFVGDVVKMHDELQGLKHKLDVLYKYAGRRQVRHYKRVLPHSNGSKQVPDTKWTDWSERYIGPSSAWDFMANDWHQSPTFQRPGVRVALRTRWMVRPTYHASLRFHYTLPIRDAQSEVDAKLDLLGVRFDPSIVWNAIPFSFAVDWVADVSSFLKRFKKDNFPINTHITDFCHSLVWEQCAEIEVRYIDDNAWWNNLPAGIANPRPTTERRIQCYDGRRRSYTRVVAPVPDQLGIEVRAPRLREIALSGSLLLNKSKYLKRASSYQYLIPSLGNPRKNAQRLKIL